MPTPTTTEASWWWATRDREVLGGGGGLDAAGPHPEALEELAAGAAASRLGAQQHVVGGAQHLGGRQRLLVGADHEHVRCQAGLREGAGAALDPDQHGALLAQEGLEALQLGHVVRAVGDDHHGPAGDAGAQPGQAEAVEQEVLLAAQELGAGVGQHLELAGQAGARRVHVALHVLEVARPAPGDRLVGHPHAALVDAHARAVADGREPVGAELVDQRDALLGQHLRAQGRVAAREQGRRVDARRRPRRRRAPARRPVEVGLVDHGHVARLEARQQGAGAVGRPGRRRSRPGSGVRERGRVGTRMTRESPAADRRAGIRAPGRGAGSAAGAHRPGGLEQLAGMGQGGVGVLQPGEHPGELPLAAGVVEHA